MVFWLLAGAFALWIVVLVAIWLVIGGWRDE